MRATGRAGYVPDNRLWFDKNGKRLPILYLYEPNEVSDDVKKSFEYETGQYAERTCLEFRNLDNKDKDKLCADDQKESPKIWVREVGGGTAEYGLSGDACIHLAYMHYPARITRFLLMQALGLVPNIYRNDSTKYVSLNFENLQAPVGSYLAIHRYWVGQFNNCKGKLQILPIPFDYMSAQMVSSDQHGSDEETTPVFVTMDPSQQYLLDYHYYAMLPPTFYDVLTLNTVYKCIDEWKAECEDNGKEVPKCKNHGYVYKTCECHCPPSFSGKLCEKRIGAFPYPLQEGAFEIALVDDKDYDLGTLLSIKAPTRNDADQNFKYCIFINVQIRPKDPNRLPSVKVFLPFERIEKLVTGKAGKLMDDIANKDCREGMRLLWGNSKRDGRRLACECVSTLASNEPVENARVIRGREPNMTMTLINRFSYGLETYPALSEESSKFRLLAEFHPPPVVTVKDFATPPPASPAGNSSGSDNSTLTIGSAPAAAMTAAGRSGAMTVLAAAGGGLALLLCLLLLLLKTRKKKEQGEEMREEEDDSEGSESESESGNDD